MATSTHATHIIIVSFSNEQDYKLFKIRLDRDLQRTELTKMLFLCRDKILPKTLDTCNCFLDLANLLEEAKLLSGSNALILYEILVLVRRFDLADQLVDLTDRKDKHELDSSHFFSTFRMILFLVSILLSGDDIRRLKELLPDKHAARESHSIFDIFIAMENLDRITHRDLSVLMEFAEKCQNQAMLNLLAEYLQEKDRASDFASLWRRQNPLSHSLAELNPKRLKLFYQNIPHTMASSLSSISTELSTEDTLSAPSPSLEEKGSGMILNLCEHSEDSSLTSSHGCEPSESAPLMSEYHGTTSLMSEYHKTTTLVSEPYIIKPLMSKPNETKPLMSEPRGTRSVIPGSLKNTPLMSDPHGTTPLKPDSHDISWLTEPQVTVSLISEESEYNPDAKSSLHAIAVGEEQFDSLDLENRDIKTESHARDTNTESNARDINTESHARPRSAVFKPPADFTNQRCPTLDLTEKSKCFEYEFGYSAKIPHTPEVFELDAYKMKSNPKGLCIIINNVKFDSEQNTNIHFKTRHGSEKDRVKVQTLFEEFGFEVHPFQNLASRQIHDLFRIISTKVDHSGLHAFVCVLLTHGTEGHIYGCDSRPVPIASLIERVDSSTCASLRGKPKLFFIQACRGFETVQESTDLIASDFTLSDPDFLVCNATLPGKDAYRNISEGSWFISALVSNLYKYHKNYDLMSILHTVNKEVSSHVIRSGDVIQTQIPVPQTTLTKRVMFSIGNR